MRNKCGEKGIRKCIASPKNPNCYTFDMERPERIGDEQIKECKKKVHEFLKKQ